MENDILKFLDGASSAIDEIEKRAIGFGREEEKKRALDESATVTSTLSSYEAQPRVLTPYQGKDSDSEIVFFFEDGEDARTLYNFMIESGLLEPGEVVLRDESKPNSVAFMPSVVVGKPEVIQSAMMAYEDQMEFGEDSDEEAFEGLVAGLTDLLTEAPNKTSGAPKRKKGMGNPFHDKNTGKFAGVSRHASDGGGSWAIKKTKLKFTGKGKTKEGGLLGKYGSTKHPCGRAAREKGKDIRCWDGKKGKGRVSEAIEKRRRGEDLSMIDLSAIMELKAKYGK
jgi:hypothetical protein